MADNPFAKYGGKPIDDDPFAKYGGSTVVTDESVQPPNAGLSSPGKLPIPDKLKTGVDPFDRGATALGANISEFLDTFRPANMKKGAMTSGAQRIQNLANAPGPSDVAKQLTGANRPAGDWAGSAGQMGGEALKLWLMKKATDPFMPEPAPIPQKPVAPDVAARNITKAINPAAEEFPAVERGISKELGNAQQYAKENGIDMNTREGAVKAFRGAAEARKAHYNSLLDPYANETVKAPGNFSGKTYESSTGPNTTLRDLQLRLRELNKLSRQPRQAGQTGKVLAGLDSAEEAEAAAIRQTLDAELSQRTGIPSSEIGRLRDSYGTLYDLADKTNMAVVRETKGEVNLSRTGSPSVPTSKAGLIDRALIAAQGGAVKIGNRQFSRALTQLNVEPNPLPTATPQPLFRPPAEQRTPVWQGMNTEGVPVGVQATTPFEAQALQQEMAQRMARRASIREMLQRSQSQQAAQSAQRLATRQDMAKNRY